VSDPEILRGKPRIKGTRIPVGLVLGYLAAGKTSADILAEFPISPASKLLRASTMRVNWPNLRPSSDGPGGF